MKRNSIFFASALLCASTSLAQGVAGDTGTFTPLLPEGVTGYASDRELDWAEENIAVAGSQEKGYKAYFVAGEDIHGKELWATDGTPEGTYLVKDIYPGPNSSNITWLTRFNDKVIFSATDADNGQEVWISDGTEDGTYMVRDINCK